MGGLTDELLASDIAFAFARYSLGLLAGAQ